MNDTMVETEIKLYVPDLAPLPDRIEAAGGALVSPRVLEYNIRYDSASHGLTERGIVLRLRRDARVRLTYKEAPQAASDVISRLEAEVTLDDFETMDFILRRLGVVPFTVYEKYRTTYRLGAVEIVLDEMPYGSFVEIEGPAPAIRAALDTLDLGRHIAVKTSYLGLFAQMRTALGLGFTDLTFANFEGVTIPGAFFEALR